MSVPPSGYPPAGGFGPGGEPGPRRTRPDEDTIIAGGPAGPQGYPGGQQPQGSPPPGWQPWAPSWTPPTGPPPGGRSSGRWWLIGAVVVVVAALVGTGVWFVAGRVHKSESSTTASSSSVAPASSSAPKPTSTAPSSGSAAPSTTTPGAGANVSADALPGLLLDPEALDSLLVTDGLKVIKDTSDFPTGTATPADCLGTVAPVEQPVYAGSGFGAMRLQQLHQAGEQFQNDVAQAVVSFGNAGQAKAFVDTQSRKWSGCAYKTVNATLGHGPNQDWHVVNPSSSAGVLTVSTSVQVSGTGTWGCQRALTAKSNVVIDVRLCSASGSSQAPDVTNEIAKRISGS